MKLTRKDTAPMHTRATPSYKTWITITDHICSVTDEAKAMNEVTDMRSYKEC